LLCRSPGVSTEQGTCFVSCRQQCWLTTDGHLNACLGLRLLPRAALAEPALLSCPVHAACCLACADQRLRASSAPQQQSHQHPRSPQLRTAGGQEPCLRSAPIMSEEVLLYEELLLDEQRSSLAHGEPGGANRGAARPSDGGRPQLRPQLRIHPGCMHLEDSPPLPPPPFSPPASRERAGRTPQRPPPAAPPADRAPLPPPPAAALFVAPDSSKAAVLDATGSRVSLYGQKSGFARRAVTFTPPPPAVPAPAAPPPASAYEGAFFQGAGAAVAGQLGRHAAAEAQPGDTVLGCAWSPDSKLLLVLCASSIAYVIDGWGGPAAPLPRRGGWGPWAWTDRVWVPERAAAASLALLLAKRQATGLAPPPLLPLRAGPASCRASSAPAAAGPRPRWRRRCLAAARGRCCWPRRRASCCCCPTPTCASPPPSPW
jgi:hypothetical protein